MKKAIALCLCSRADNILECSVLHEDGGILRGNVVVEGMGGRGKVEVAGKAAFGARHNKLRNIGINT
eukprot:13335672-Ditylum_brightwellii.AAC.1